MRWSSPSFEWWTLSTGKGVVAHTAIAITVDWQAEAVTAVLSLRASADLERRFASEIAACLNAGGHPALQPMSSAVPDRGMGCLSAAITVLRYHEPDPLDSSGREIALRAVVTEAGGRLLAKGGTRRKRDSEQDVWSSGVAILEAMRREAAEDFALAVLEMEKFGWSLPVVRAESRARRRLRARAVLGWLLAATGAVAARFTFPFSGAALAASAASLIAAWSLLRGTFGRDRRRLVSSVPTTCHQVE